MKKYTSTIAAFLLIIAAIVNIRCEAEKLEKQRQQAVFLQYIHENSKPYKQSLKQDSIFAQRLDSIKLLQSSFGEGTVRNGKVNKIQSSLQEMNVKKPQNLYKKK